MAAFVLEQRVIPIYREGIPPYYGRSGLYYEQDQQLMGRAAGLDVSKNLYHERIELMYGIRFKYDVLLFRGPPSAGSGEAEHYWGTDQLISLLGRFPLDGKKEVRASAGIGFMNNGSDFSLTEVDSLPNGQTIAWTSFSDFRYTSNFVTASYFDRGFEIGLCAYFVGESNFDLPSSFILPSIFLKYAILR